jgi:hypothetical protein
MKKNNTRFLFTTLENGKQLAMVTRQTEKGASDYANRMFKKYGDFITVEEYQFINDDIKKTCVWSA